ncbi:MAG TPA: hypothetical protein VFY75_10375 [Solirubrobacterales bacterium]|nr:hypothetical protein [Solirubrobacterales bacterium]
MRRLAPLLLVAVLALAGCGDSSEETSATAPLESGVDQAPDVRSAWEENPECERPQGASRWGCSVGSYRCQGVVSDRGWTISCSKRGQSIAFRVRPD